jgi:actin-related protein 6
LLNLHLQLLLCLAVPTAFETSPCSAASAMPRQSKAAEASRIKDNTLVVDNGAYSIKAGFVTPAPDPQDCHLIPNCIARDSDKKVWVGAQLEQCKDFREMAFRRPVDKGYLVNWEGEKAIWGQSFFSLNSPLQVRCGHVYEATI